MDRQTDRRTDGRTELLYQYRASAAVCWRAIKINEIWNNNWVISYYFCRWIIMQINKYKWINISVNQSINRSISRDDETRLALSIRKRAISLGHFRDLVSPFDHYGRPPCIDDYCDIRCAIADACAISLPGYRPKIVRDAQIYFEKNSGRERYRLSV